MSEEGGWERNSQEKTVQRVMIEQLVVFDHSIGFRSRDEGTVKVCATNTDCRYYFHMSLTDIDTSKSSSRCARSNNILIL